MSDFSYTSEKELINCIAFESGLSIEATKKFLYSTKKVILKQLQLNHRLSFPNFGIFEDYVREGKVKVMGSFLGGTQSVYINPKVLIKFKPSNTLIYELNDDYRLKYTEKKKKTRKRKPKEAVYKKKDIKKENVPFDFLFQKTLNKKVKKSEENK
jgi:nucleoid DNA-binding protein